MKLTLKNQVLPFYMMMACAPFLLSACSEQEDKSGEVKNEAPVEQPQMSDSKQAVVETLEPEIAEQMDEVAEQLLQAAGQAPDSSSVAAAPEDSTQEMESTAEASTTPKTHSIRAVVTKFDPMVLFINPGDTVTWTNMVGHDTASIEGMIPEGAEAWHSKMGTLFSHTFTKEGAYIYQCTPHVSLGMLGAIVVGNESPSNLDEILANPGNKGMVGRTIRKLKKALDER